METKTRDVPERGAMNIETIEVVKSEARQIAVQANGSGVPFVWGHTLLGCMAQEDATGVFGWQDLTDIARVIRFDAIGHGRSEASQNPNDHTWESRADDLWEVANNYASKEQVVLGGASMGSATALHAACKHPGRVKALILVIPPTAWEERERQVKQYLKVSFYLTLLGGRGFKWLARAARFELRRKRGFREKLERNTALHMNVDDPDTIIAALHGAAKSDLPSEELLAKLDMPTLILAWPNDRVHPVSTAEKLASILPNAILSVAVHRKEPFEWPDVVREFIQNVVR